MSKKPDQGTPSREPGGSQLNSQPDLPVVQHLTPHERAALGKAARSQIPRSGHAAWAPPDDRPDPVNLLEAQAATRVPELVPIRYGRMLASPFAFYRGAAVIMASDLATMPNTGLQVQLCGDAHIANFGGFASPERELVLDVNDFDETLPGPWEWDVKRLAASVEIASRQRGFEASVRRDLVLASVGEYSLAMREFSGMGNLDLWYLHLTLEAIKARWGTSVKPKAIKALRSDLTHAHHRDNQRAFEKLTHKVNGQLKIVSNPPLVEPIEDVLSGEGYDRFEKTIRGLIRSYRSTLQPNLRLLLERYQFVHIARKVVGVGSVGTRTWILLLIGRDEGDPLFLQAKEATPSVLEPYLTKSQYKNQGQRVVVGQWMMQASSDIFLGWVKVPLGYDERAHDYYIRQLWDWKISVDFDLMEPGEMKVWGQVCGWTLARAHARSGDRIAISAYLGKAKGFDTALAEFASAYADQNELDYQALVEAVKSGQIKAETGV